MKKSILILATIGSCFTGFAQDIVVESALTDLKSHNLDAAKEEIDRAMNYPATKEKPKALYAKARIYMQIQLEKVPKYIESHPYREAAQALMKLAEIKPDYEKADVDDNLKNCAIMYFNDGTVAFNAKKSAEGIEYMINVVKIHDLNGGKRYVKYPPESFLGRKFDTVSANANVLVANSYIIDTSYEKAIPYLLSAINNPISKTSANFNFLIEAYNKLHKDKEVFETLEAGRKAFPNDRTLRNNEIYYYFKAGKQDELVKKLEDAVKAEPYNDELQFNLGVLYLDMLSSKENTNKANAADMIKKAEAAFTVALSKSPDNTAYNYNFGVLYYDEGKDANEQMNTLADKINEKGNKAAKEDQKKYDDLKKERDSYFAKSLVYFEKVNNQLGPKSSSLSKEDMITYKNCLTALKDAYTILGKDDKYKEVKEKLDALGN